jgi:hypothetical protein
MNIQSKLYTAILLVAIFVVSGCGGDDDHGGTSTEQKQLGLLSKTWTIKSATQDVDRTDDFKEPDLTLQLSGTFNAAKAKGPYSYTIDGNMPIPSPWKKGTGVWMFADDAATTIVRGDGVSMKYVLTGNTLTLTFTCTTCNETNGRPASAEGNWEFVFTSSN